MPIYVYRNLATGETFEVEQRMVDAALTTDPTTGDPVKRLIQPVGIAFKGSGFYVTDSRGKKAASSAKPPGSNGAAKADSGSSDAGSKGDGGAAEKGAGSDATPAAPPAKATKPSGSTGATASD